MINMPNRRNSVNRVLDQLTLDSSINAGLWLDKFPVVTNDGDKACHFENLTKIAQPVIYKSSFKSWQNSLRTIGAQSKELKISGRMIVGLGGEGVLENSITLHRVYGIPYIPGSALKGLAASYAHKNLGDDWKRDGRFHRLVFGSQDFAGLVTFHDALLIPNSDKLPLHQEVMTVHHEGYYGEKIDRDTRERLPPADWDSPVPIPFVSASGSYLVALSTELEDNTFLNKVFKILALAFEEEGVGAKTSSGYGRGKLDDLPETDEERSMRLRLEAEESAKEIERFKIAEESKARATKAAYDAEQQSQRDQLQQAEITKAYNLSKQIDALLENAKAKDVQKISNAVYTLKDADQKKILASSLLTKIQGLDLKVDEIVLTTLGKLC